MKTGSTYVMGVSSKHSYCGTSVLIILGSSLQSSYVLSAMKTGSTYVMGV